MMWYQTGPYKAYFYSGRYMDVINLANVTLTETISKPTIEESIYWRGRAKYMIGDTPAAIADFRERAARVAAALGKGWKIKHLSLNAPPRQPVPTRLRAAPMMAEAAPMPIDAGESEVSVSISGQIELAD